MDIFDLDPVKNVPICSATFFNLLSAFRNKNHIENMTTMYDKFARLLYPEFVSRENNTDVSHFRSCDGKHKQPLPFSEPHRINFMKTY